MKNFLGMNLLFLSLLFSCNEKSEEKGAFTNKASENELAISNDSLAPQQKTMKKWNIIATKIDSVAFVAIKQKIKPKKESLEKITDFQIAKKMLEGRVRFGDWDNDSERMISNNTGESVSEIMDIKTHAFKQINDIFSFVAYYPRLDILLCEGGHTTDISFNLTTGEETETTGNPDYMITSKSKHMRLCSHYEGQECYSSFIQKETNGKFEKIIELDEEFEKATKLWLCTIGEAFWLDDSTLFLEETDNSDAKNNPVSYYYKIELVKK